MTSSGRKDGGDRSQGIKLRATTTPLASWRLENRQGGGWGEVEKLRSMCVYSGNLVYHLCCRSSFSCRFITYGIYYLRKLIIISERNLTPSPQPGRVEGEARFRLTQPTHPRQRRERKKKNFKWFLKSELGREEKSEHLSKNLSDSLNIYVDLFQLIDFLSM